MWYYLIFWFAFLALSLLLTSPGQHAIKYVLSRKFPSINNRIVDLILELENSRQVQTQFSIAYESHLQRQRDGWVSGYKLKTRQYSGANGRAENEKEDCSDVMHENSISKEAKLIDDANDKDSTGKAANLSAVVKTRIDIEETTREPDEEPQDAKANNPDSCSINSNDQNMCTICLLDIEEGDTVADVKCGHVFHAECISEWILKKVRMFMNVKKWS